MANNCVYISLKPYLHQWLVHEFGEEPILFPKGSAEADLLEFLLTRPRNSAPLIANNNMVAIQIPHLKHKPREFTYLSPRAQAALARLIYVRFQVEMWEDLHTVDNSFRIIGDVIYAWLDAHGIETTPQNWETVRQMYYRKRKRYLKLKDGMGGDDFDE